MMRAALNAEVILPPLLGAMPAIRGLWGPAAAEPEQIFARRGCATAAMRNSGVSEFRQTLLVPVLLSARNFSLDGGWGLEDDLKSAVAILIHELSAIGGSLHPIASFFRDVRRPGTP